MSEDIARLLKHFDHLAESTVTPTSVKKGLNRQQRSVPQLPALFKPRKISVLQNPHDPKHPMHDYAVGASESKNMASEDVVSTVKKKLGDYLHSITDAVSKDTDLMDRLSSQRGDQLGPAVKTITTSDGHEIKIHGNEDDGFRLTVKNKSFGKTFENIDTAVKMCEMLCNRRQSHTADYMEES